MKTHIVFFDANFLLVPAQFGIDVFEQLEELIPRPWKIIIIKPVIEELEKKKARNPHRVKLIRQINLAFQILEQKKYELLSIPRPMNQLVDDVLLNAALAAQNSKPNNIIYIATNDKELRAKCKKKRIRVIYLRKLKYLNLEIE